MCFPQKTIGKLRISILFFVCNCHTQFLYFGLVRFADVCTFWCQDGQSSEAQTLGWWNLRPVFLVSKKLWGPRGASVFPASCSASIGSTWSQHLRSCRWTWIVWSASPGHHFSRPKSRQPSKLSRWRTRNSQPWCGVEILWYAKHHRVADEISSKESAITKRIMKQQRIQEQELQVKTYISDQEEATLKVPVLQCYSVVGLRDSRDSWLSLILNP